MPGLREEYASFCSSRRMGRRLLPNMASRTQDPEGEAPEEKNRVQRHGIKITVKSMGDDKVEIYSDWDYKHWCVATDLLYLAATSNCCSHADMSFDPIGDGEFSQWNITLSGFKKESSAKFMDEYMHTMACGLGCLYGIGYPSLSVWVDWE